MINQPRRGKKQGIVQLLERIMEASATVNRNMDVLIRIEKQRGKRDSAEEDLFQRVLNAPLKTCQFRK